jgi:hypothetical protein
VDVTEIDLHANQTTDNDSTGTQRTQGRHSGGHGMPRTRTHMQRSAYNVMHAHDMPITAHLYERGLWQAQERGAAPQCHPVRQMHARHTDMHVQRLSEASHQHRHAAYCTGMHTHVHAYVSRIHTYTRYIYPGVGCPKGALPHAPTTQRQTK